MLLHLLHGIGRRWLLRFPSLPMAGRPARAHRAGGRPSCCACWPDCACSASRPRSSGRVPRCWWPTTSRGWTSCRGACRLHRRRASSPRPRCKAWPLLGWLIKGAGTLFIEREKQARRAARRCTRWPTALQRRRHSVAVFPEGTTGHGPELLPFHANLLQSAITTGTPVQPVVLRYADAFQHRFSPKRRSSSATPRCCRASGSVLSNSRDLVRCTSIVLEPQGTRTCRPARAGRAPAHADRRSAGGVEWSR